MEARPNFAKTKRGASGGFLPRPLLLRLRHPNSEKRNQPKFCGILSPENCFRKTSSALFQISSSGFISKKVRILYNEYRMNPIVENGIALTLKSLLERSYRYIQMFRLKDNKEMTSNVMPFLTTG